MDKRTKVAFALFAHMYRNDIADDQTFPDRVWSGMSDEQRQMYFEQSDAAILAGA
ncbi:MAG: hypothetical protein P4L90_25805 [Rhodopila sp.]|nr:hypothetical protein [Rhodopila sp.]